MENRAIITGRKSAAIRGFSLIESLISLSLFIFVVISCLEFFVSARAHFLQLKEEQESDVAAFAGMDKMKLDIQESGRGILIPQTLGIIKGVESNEETLIIKSVNTRLSLVSNLVSGQTRLSFQTTSGISKGQEICICDDNKGETHMILSLDRDSLVLSSPLIFSYSQQGTMALSIKTIIFYLDKKNQILRRKVNASPAQPLLEEVDNVHFSYSEESNLVNIDVKTKKEEEYEISVFPKNMGLMPTKKTF